MVLPAATTTLPGTVASGEFEVSVTVNPPVGAGPFKVTVPADGTPPATLVGFRLKEDIPWVFTLRVAVSTTGPSVPVIVTATEVLTGTVVIAKVAVVAPAATVTLPGIVTDELLDDSFTTIPPVGAFPLSVTVPVEDAPPTTDVGETVTLDNCTN